MVMILLSQREQVCLVKEGENLLEIKGKFNTAICYANVIEEEAIAQIC